MSRATRLKMLADLARNKERLAGFELQKLRRNLTEQDKQLDDLDGYRSEYSQRLGEAGSEGLEVSQLQNYHLFFRQLNDAIDQQGTVVESHHAHLEEGEERWRLEYKKANTLDKTVEKIEEGDRRELEKKSELAQDEMINIFKMKNRFPE